MIDDLGPASIPLVIAAWIVLIVVEWRAAKGER